MINKIFPKITAIEGGAASVTSPGFAMGENSAVVFLIGASETPLTVMATGYKGEDSVKSIPFKTKELAGTDWKSVNADGLELEETGAFLVAIPADVLAHDELDRVSLTLGGGTDGTTPETIFAFEFTSRYIPE